MVMFDRLRCAVTGNYCGTDIWGNGVACECTPCRQWLAAFNEGMAAARLPSIAPTGDWPLGGKTVFAGRITLDNQAQPLMRICTACSGSGLYVDYGGPGDNTSVATACKACGGAGRLP